MMIVHAYFLTSSMKILLSFFFLVVTLATSSFADAGLTAAQKLAADDIIVDQSTRVTATSSTSDAQSVNLYRLGSPISRQEAIGVVLKLAKVTLNDNYTCRDYFSDVREGWVCRAVEIAADREIVSRVNARFRPADTLTLSESLALLVKGLDIRLSNTATSTITADIPDWQKRMILTINESGIGVFRLDSGVYVYDVDSDASFGLSQRMSRGDFFRIAVLFLELQDPLNHCETFSDGCNECSTDDAGQVSCTERQCIWQGIPQCHTCDEGYVLK